MMKNLVYCGVIVLGVMVLVWHFTQSDIDESDRYM